MGAHEGSGDQDGAAHAPSEVRRSTASGRQDRLIVRASSRHFASLFYTNTRLHRAARERLRGRGGTPQALNALDRDGAFESERSALINVHHKDTVSFLLPSLTSARARGRRWPACGATATPDAASAAAAAQCRPQGSGVRARAAGARGGAGSHARERETPAPDPVVTSRACLRPCEIG